MMAGRPRKTELELLVTGQWRKDRHASRSQGPTRRLGNPPKHLTPEQRRVWRETASVAPWLTAADRQPLELHCCLMAEARADFAAMSATRIGLLSRQASKLGLGPTDRARLTPHPEPKPNRF